MSLVSALLRPENIVTDVSEPITEPHQCRDHQPSAAIRPPRVNVGRG